MKTSAIALEQRIFAGVQYEYVFDQRKETLY